MNSLHTLSAYKNNNTERTVHTLSVARDQALREQLSLGRLLDAPNAVLFVFGRTSCTQTVHLIIFCQ